MARRKTPEGFNSAAKWKTSLDLPLLVSSLLRYLWEKKCLGCFKCDVFIFSWLTLKDIMEGVHILHVCGIYGIQDGYKGHSWNTPCQWQLWVIRCIRLIHPIFTVENIEGRMCYPSEPGLHGPSNQMLGPERKIIISVFRKEMMVLCHSKINSLSLFARTPNSLHERWLDPR